MSLVLNLRSWWAPVSHLRLKCSKISNTNCLPNKPKQTVQTMIRLLLQKLFSLFIWIHGVDGNQCGSQPESTLFIIWHYSCSKDNIMSQIMLWPHIAMTTSVTTMKIFIEIIFEGDKIVFKRSYDTLTESYTLDHFKWNSLNWLKACLMNFIWNDPLWIFFFKKLCSQMHLLCPI